MASFFKKSKNKKGPTALSEEELNEISGGYEQISADILGKPVFRGIDGNGDEFYTINEALAKNTDISGISRNVTNELRNVDKILEENTNIAVTNKNISNKSRIPDETTTRNTEDDDKKNKFNTKFSTEVALELIKSGNEIIYPDNM